MSKQMMRAFGALLSNVDPDQVSEEIIKWINQHPREAGVEATKWLVNGCRLIVDESKKPVPAIKVIDPIIRLDRSSEFVYPDSMHELVHPALEHTGPAEYDATKLRQVLFPEQYSHALAPQVVYERLEKTGELGTCLGMRDLNAIQRKGLTFFRQNWEGKYIFGWRSIVRVAVIGCLIVPCLYEYKKRLVLQWESLPVCSKLGKRCPVFHFPS